MEYLVDIVMPVYNHERYIAQAIESVLSQKASFNYRLIIGEDCSTDGSRAIISKYHADHPEKIFPFYREKNLGAYKNSELLSAEIKSPYVAILEGDDYWTDNNKLQKQVDFLEKNKDFSMCFTSAEVKNEMEVSTITFPVVKDEYTVEDLVEGRYFIFIPTLVFRNLMDFNTLPFYRKTMCRDIAMGLLLADNGKAKFFHESTAVYRQHNASLSRSAEFMSKLDRSLFDLLDDFNEHTHRKYHKPVMQKLFPMSKNLLMDGSALLKGKERKQHIARMLKGYIKYSGKLNMKELLYFIAVLYFPFVLKPFNKPKTTSVN